MADNQQQNGSQQFENTEGQQQQHLNGTADNSNTNNDSGQFECVRDDDRSGEILLPHVNRSAASDTTVYVTHTHTHAPASSTFRHFPNDSYNNRVFAFSIALRPDRSFSHRNHLSPGWGNIVLKVAFSWISNYIRLGFGLASIGECRVVMYTVCLCLYYLLFCRSVDFGELLMHYMYFVY